MNKSIIERLISQSVNFYEKAQYYREKGELEGALINYLLSANALHTVEPEFQTVKAIVSNKQNEMKYRTWCDNKCNDIQEILNRILREIAPLQEELKRRKLFRPNGGSDSDTSCANIRQMLIQGEDCIYFDDIVGQYEAKEAMKNLFIYPLVFPNLYPKKSSGILLYGPPGTGKSLLAKAAAVELQSLNEDVGILFYAPTPDQLKGKYVGDTEKNIARYFDCASEAASECTSASAKKKYISVLFFDEFDSIASSRSTEEGATSSVNILLQKMQGVKEFENVVVIAATNYASKIDPAILRRFNRRIYVKLPTPAEKIELLEQEIDKFIEIDDSKFKYQPGATAFSEAAAYLRKTTSKIKTCGGTLCTRKPPNRAEPLYMRRDYANLIPISHENIAAIVAASNPLLSASDIITWANAVFTEVADRARNNGLFYALKQVNGKSGAPLTTKVYMSAELIHGLSGDKLNYLLQTLDKNDKMYAEIPEILQYSLNKVDFDSKILFEDEEWLPLFTNTGIHELYLHQQNQNEFLILFPLFIVLKWQNVSEKKKIWVQSYFNKEEFAKFSQTMNLPTNPYVPIFTDDDKNDLQNYLFSQNANVYEEDTNKWFQAEISPKTFTDLYILNREKKPIALKSEEEMEHSIFGIIAKYLKHESSNIIPINVSKLTATQLAPSNIENADERIQKYRQIIANERGKNEVLISWDIRPEDFTKHKPTPVIKNIKDYDFSN